MASITIHFDESLDENALNRLRVSIYKNLLQQHVPVICSYTSKMVQVDTQPSQNDTENKPLDNPKT